MNSEDYSIPTDREVNNLLGEEGNYFHGNSERIGGKTYFIGHGNEEVAVYPSCVGGKPYKITKEHFYKLKSLL